MDAHLYELAANLKQALSEHEWVVATERAQAIMLQDAAFQAKRLLFSTAQSRYEDAERYHLDVTPYQRDLAQAKQALYELPVVQAYLQQLKHVQAMLREVTTLVFDEVVFDYHQPAWAWLQTGSSPLRK
ncbi:MAG: YlbF family regulator [Bacilli bacterium]